MNSQVKGPIFVVGSPRTGTTLTQEILSLHPEVHLYNEIHYNERVVDVLGDRDPLSPQDLDQAMDIMFKSGEWAFGSAEQGRQVVLDRLKSEDHPTHGGVLKAFLSGEAEAHGKTIWGDSSPQDILYMDVLKRWYPTAKFVGVVRDPRAFLASYKNYVRKGSVRYQNRFNPLTNSLLWRSYMNALLKAGNSPLAADLILLKYEDLVTDPEKHVRGLCDFLGLDFHPGMLAIQRANSSYLQVQEEKQQPGIRTVSLDRWRGELTRTELWILEKVCSETMTRFGYAPERVRPGFRDLPDLAVTAFHLPKRLFNMLFRSHKPFTLEKVKRVLGTVNDQGKGSG